MSALTDLLYSDSYRPFERKARRSGRTRASIYGIKASAGARAGGVDFNRRAALLRYIERKQQEAALQDTIASISKAYAGSGSADSHLTKLQELMDTLRRRRGREMYSPSNGYVAPGGQGMGGGAYNESDIYGGIG